MMYDRTPAQKRVSLEYAIENATYNIHLLRKKAFEKITLKRESSHIVIKIGNITVGFLYDDESDYVKRQIINSVAYTVDACERTRNTF